MPYCNDCAYKCSFCIPQIVSDLCGGINIPLGDSKLETFGTKLKLEGLKIHGKVEGVGFEIELQCQLIQNCLTMGELSPPHPLFDVFSRPNMLCSRSATKQQQRHHESYRNGRFCRTALRTSLHAQCICQSLTHPCQRVYPPGPLYQTISYSFIFIHAFGYKRSSKLMDFHCACTTLTVVQKCRMQAR